MKIQLRPFTPFTLALALLLAAPAFAADIQPITTSTALAAGMSVDEIVARLGQQNAQRAAALHGFEGKRSYRLSYHGFPSGIQAEMDVVAHYQAPENKSFDVVSESGSKLLQYKVLRSCWRASRRRRTPTISARPR